MTAESVDFDPFAGPVFEKTAPTTESQRELIAAVAMGSDASCAFNESVSLRFSGALDVGALHRALGDLVDRHESLRSIFSADGATQLVQPRGAHAHALPVIDLSGFSVGERDEQLRALLAREVETAFDLLAGPLLRTQLIKLDAETHQLTLTAHHVVCDGFSLGVMLRDLGALYSARAGGAAAQLAPAPSFVTYALNERKAESTPAYAAARAYWLGQFANGAPELELPTDRRRPPLKTYASRRVDFPLSRELTEQVKKLGGKHGCSFFATLLAGFATTLYKLSGQPDLVVGIPAAGQAAAGEQHLVGHGVNMLPLRFSLTPELRFTELCKQARKVMLDGNDHQQLAFGALLKQLSLQRDPSRLPLVSVLFNVDKAAHGNELGFKGVDVRFSSNPRHFENFELFINAAETDGATVVECQYNTDLFDAATIERWLGGLRNVLEGVAANPDATLAQLGLLTAAEAQTVASWSDTRADFDPARTIDAWFEACVDATPDKTAIVFGDEQVSYAVLDARANRIAHGLRAAGVGAGTLVGLCVERSIDMVAGLLGVLKAGGAYVPLDPAYPKDRLRFMVSDSKMPVLLLADALVDVLADAHVEVLADARVEVLPAHSTRVVTLSGCDSQPATRPERRASAEQPAYVIYTSGSTGRPKGVCVPHRAVSNFITAMQTRPGLAASDRLLAVTTLSFDIAVLELHVPLCTGATVMLASREQAQDGAALLSLIAHATVMQATPSTWRLLIGAGWAGGKGLKALVGGEALPKDLAAQLCERAAEVWNMYGPTETTVWSTCQRINHGEPIRIGKPIGNTAIEILDADLKRQPIGVSGELHIGGAGVTLGYLHRPELTAERFIPDPFRPGQTLYKTGDVARWLPDGSIDFIGRNDNQVKVRGFRIELGEIEAALASHPEVTSAAVIVREDRPGDVRIVAYVTTAPGAKLAAAPGQLISDDTGLRTHLRTTLPDYMVPQHFLALSALPLTPNGKLDRKALPAPQLGRDERAFIAPESDAERHVAEIWQQTLGVDRLSVTANFFELGGHSLLAAQAMTRLSKAHDVQLSMRKLFEAPTVRQMAKVLEAAKRGGTDQRLRIPRLTGDGDKPLSLMQQRLWMMEEISPGTALYNLPSAFRFRGRVDWAALERALNEIVRRQDSLRTTLQWRDNQPRQRIAAELKLDLQPLDLSALPQPEREAKMMALLEAAANETFDLQRGPLVKTLGIKLAEQEHVLFFMPHHAIWDGWSFDLFLRELSTIYAAYSKGEAHKLPELPVRYADFAAWHREFMAGPELERQSRYWRQQLAGTLQPLELPTDKPRPAQLSYAGATLPFELNASEIDALNALGRSHGATLYMVMLAAFKALLYRYTKQDDLIVGTPIRGRGQPEVEEVIGYFVNTLVLRTQLDPGLSFAELLSRVRAVVLDGFAHQDMPFEHLLSELAVQRDLSRTPIFQAFFTFQDVSGRGAMLGDIPYGQIHVHAAVAPTDVSLWVKETGRGLVGGIDYATDLFDEATMQRFLAHYRQLLRLVAGNAQLKLAELDVLTPEEAAQLVAWNDTSAPYPRSTVHARFEAQVDATPQAIALSFAGEDVSYAALDAQANRIAHALRAQGVTAGSLVGLCVERSIEMVAGLLGVLKAGGAYVPLDPAYPRERLAFMIDDAQLPVVLTSAALDAALVGALLPPDKRARTRVLTVEGCAAQPATRVDTPMADAEQPAYVIYTSGSTGQPKGVCVPHRAVSNFIASMQRTPGIQASDRVVAVTTLSFDIAVLELHVPLCTGARVLLTTREEAQDGARLRPLAEAATLMQATPATWRLLLASGWRGAPGFKALVGGEALPKDLADSLCACTSELWNMYGPTETTVWSTCQRVAPGAPIRIGKPIANTHVEILDASLRRLPIGVAGELHIGGAGVTLGYLHRPELTAERFISDPFRPGERLYKTGDLARWTADGSIDFIGRNDNQVKVRGFRIELGEIEATLAKHASVAIASVIVREDRAGDVRIVAYVVPKAGEDFTDTELRRHLRKTLPEYMLPQHFVELDRLPLTPNGKVDRKALPPPFSTAATQQAGVPPRTEQEKLLGALWCQALGIASVSVHDNFFNLGGHSLLCLQVIAKLEAQTGVHLNPRVMLLNTLEQTAELVTQQSRTGAQPAQTTPATEKPAERLSFAQRLLQKLGKG